MIRNEFFHKNVFKNLMTPNIFNTYEKKLMGSVYTALLSKLKHGFDSRSKQDK